MDGGNRLDNIHNGMVARSADGKRLGKITQIYTRDTETYLEVTPRGNLWKPWQLMVAVQRLFLPGTTVTEVAGKYVSIAMNASSAKGCTSRHNWIQREVDKPHTIPSGGAGNL